MKTMDAVIGAERECTLLGTLFQYIITDLKSSSPAWDDLVSKGFKLHSLLKSTTGAMSGFVEAMQKIADAATHTKGSTKDVGSALTRICVRQKMVENKLKQFTSALMDNLLCPVQEKVEEWKKMTTQLEKDHAKEYKRATSEIKKRNSDTLRLQKKARKASKGDVQFQINAVMYDMNERFTALGETEKTALRNLLVEERSRICQFANCLTPVLDVQVSMLNEVDHLQDLSEDMANLCRNPMQLPTSTEQLINDFLSNNDQLSSPTTLEAPPNTTFHHTANSTNTATSPNLNEYRAFSRFSFSAETSVESRANVSLSRSATLHHRKNRSASHQLLRRTSSGGGCVINPEELPASNEDHFSSVSSRDSGCSSVPSWESSTMTSFPPSGTHSTFKNPFPESNDKVDDAVDGLPFVQLHSPDTRLSDEPEPVPSRQTTFSWKDWNVPGPYEIQNVAPATHDPPLSKAAPPPVSPKPVAYQPQYSSAPVPEAQVQIPARPCSLVKTGFSYGLPPLRKDAPSIIPDPSDDPLPPPPPSLLEDTAGVDSVALSTRHRTPQHSYDVSRNTRARSSSPQPPKRYSIPQNHYDPFRNSTARNPSPKHVSEEKRNSITQHDYDPFHNNIFPAMSPTPIVDYTVHQDYDPPRNIARSPSQTSVPNYIQDNNEHGHPRRTTRVPSPQLSAPYYPQENTLRAPSPQLVIPNYMQGSGNFHAMTLGRNNSNNSLHYSTSSGYSSHHTTPACSEDTIASHDSDPYSLDTEDVPQHHRSRYDHEKYSTLPRNYHLNKAAEQPQARSNQRRLFSSVDISTPSSTTSNGNASKTATIRRTPSGKFNSLRSSSVPKAVQAPMVPGGAVANLLSTFMPTQGARRGSNPSGTENSF